jgi:hypothetical protein
MVSLDVLSVHTLAALMERLQTLELESVKLEMLPPPFMLVLDKDVIWLVLLSQLLVAETISFVAITFADNNCNSVTIVVHPLISVEMVWFVIVIFALLETPKLHKILALPLRHVFLDFAPMVFAKKWDPFRVSPMLIVYPLETLMVSVTLHRPLHFVEFVLLDKDMLLSAQQTVHMDNVLLFLQQSTSVLLVILNSFDLFVLLNVSTDQIWEKYLMDTFTTVNLWPECWLLDAKSLLLSPIAQSLHCLAHSLKRWAWLLWSLLHSWLSRK